MVGVLQREADVSQTEVASLMRGVAHQLERCKVDCERRQHAEHESEKNLLVSIHQSLVSSGNVQAAYVEEYAPDPFGPLGSSFTFSVQSSSSAALKSDSSRQRMHASNTAGTTVSDSGSLEPK